MANLNNDHLATSRQTILGLVIAACLGTMLAAGLMAALGGCQANTRTTTREITGPAQKVVASASTTVEKVKAVTPYVAPEGKQVQHDAEQSAETTQRYAEAAVASSEEFAATLANIQADNAKTVAGLEKQLRESKQETADAKKAGQDRWQKEHDAYKWLGWATWAWIGWISSVGVGLTLLGLFLNAKTDWFVLVWNFAVGVVGGLLNAIGTVFRSARGELAGDSKAALTRTGAAK